MKIFDCFMFSTEIELVELRFMELYDSVDYFVLSESNTTHTGKPKELVFEKNKDRFSEYNKKIVYLQIEDLPNYDPNTYNGMWGAENGQRNALMWGLETLASKGDKIFISDCDEIWNKKSAIKHLNDTRWLVFEQKLYYYYVNCIQNQKWYGTVMANYGTFNVLQDLRNFARNIDYTKYNRDFVIENGGWHYSFMGGASRIREKVENIAESCLIVDKVGNIKEIDDKINNLEDLWGRKDDFTKKQIVDLQDSPEKINEFLKKYPSFLYEK